MAYSPHTHEALRRLLSVSRGDEPADILLAGGRILNVFSGEIETADVALHAGYIAGTGPGYQARERVELDGAYLAPGLVDAHVHIESSLCTPPGFASAVVPRGVTTAIVDPHEIANVAGLAGIRYMAEAARGLPLDMRIMASSCVPATNMATSGATLSAPDLRALRDENLAIGLAEVMDFPAVIAGAPAAVDKLHAFHGLPIDGHCPAVRGRALCAYVAAGVGSDHECVDLDEAREKLSRGLYILIREASGARNLEALLPLINSGNNRRICFCTDDRQSVDLLADGSVDAMLRRAVQYGISPIEALRLVTLNAAEWFGLSDIGAIAPGRRANLVVFDDLKFSRARAVYFAGRLIAENGRLLPQQRLSLSINSDVSAESVRGVCRVDPQNIRRPIIARSSRMRVIGVRPGQLLTDHLIVEPRVEQGAAVSDIARDLLKICVLERHRGTGNVGYGFIQGLGLKRGAIAGSVAHDHHNLIVIGCDDDSMVAATAAVSASGGGLAIADGDEILELLPLPIAGLMTDRPIVEVGDAYARLLSAARALGSTLDDPFMTMSFMGLEVIPRLKLTDQGLVDVERFAKVELFV